jgi:uncharacterized iron-regulated membrane protein
MKKAFVFYIHAATGLVSGFFILLMSLSGAALVFHEDLDQLQHPKGNDPGFVHYDVNRSYAALQQHYPGTRISSCELPTGLSQFFVFTVYDSSYKKGSSAPGSIAPTSVSMLAFSPTTKTASKPTLTNCKSAAS